jgi:AraC-like DNA-binding protein
VQHRGGLRGLWRRKDLLQGNVRGPEHAVLHEVERLPRNHFAVTRIISGRKHNRTAVTTGPSNKELTVSIRLVWPFARLANATGLFLERIGRSKADFGNPETRIPRSFAMELLSEAMELTKDPMLGLHAAEHFEPGDLEVLEYAARSRPTLGEAMECVARYARLLDDAMEFSIERVGDRAFWRFRVTPGADQPVPVNDYVVATALEFSRRNSAVYERPLEVHVLHERPEYASEYAKVFEAPVVFGAPCNAVVTNASRLDAPMRHANPTIALAFEKHATQLLNGLSRTRGITGRVRQDVMTQLQAGMISMSETGARLAMSVATLRRRLEEEGATFSDIVDDVRKGLSKQYLRDPALSITEIAFLLGFSNVTAFGRAFKRWTGVSPNAFRGRASASDG